MVKMAKKLKKEKVNIDIINFGEEVLINTVRYFLLRFERKYENEL